MRHPHSYKESTAYRDLHVDTQRYILKYLNTEWARKAFSDVDRLTLMDCLSMEGKARQSAIHPTVRIRALRVLRSFVSYASTKEPYTLTLCPQTFALPLSADSSGAAEALSKWVLRELDGIKFLGAIDFGLYPYLKPNHYTVGLISWHVHGILWDVSPDEKARLCNAINYRADPLISGATTAQAKRLKMRRNVVQWLRYMLKPPNSVYRVVKHRLAREDEDKREFQSRDLARGKHLTNLYHAASPLKLQDLTIVTPEAWNCIRKLQDASKLAVWSPDCGRTT